MSQFLSSTTSASAEQSLLNKAPTKSWTRLVVVAAATSFALGTFVAHPADDFRRPPRHGPKVYGRSVRPGLYDDHAPEQDTIPS